VFSARFKAFLGSSLIKEVSKEEINSFKLNDAMQVAKHAQINI